jgi:hypothetical protein
MLVRAILLATVVGSCSMVLAADDEALEMEFFEYLGMWEESDEEWLIFEEPTTAGNDTRTDPAPEGEESEEKDDES